MPPIPRANIYLRNRFAIVAGGDKAFIAGKRELLSETAGFWSLIAAGGRQPLLLGRELPEPNVPMTQIWHLPDWNSLYDTMYAFSEQPWYVALVRALSTEDQQLFVECTSGYGITPRPRWRDQFEPGYVYLTEDVELTPDSTAHAYLRDVNWFASRVAPFEWSLQWAASAITGNPGTISLLWRVRDEARIDAGLSHVANDPESSARYALMMSRVQTLSRERLQPIVTEWLADHPQPA